jgi:signal transduction histidine kinase
MHAAGPGGAKPYAGGLPDPRWSAAATGRRPAGTLEGMTERPTRRDWAVAAGLTLLSALAPRAGGPAEPEPVAAWVGLLGLGLAVAQGLPLAWRRWRPAEVAAVVVVAFAGYGLLAFPAPPYAGWVAMFAVATHVPGRRQAIVAGCAVAATLAAGAVGAAVVHPEGGNELPALLMLTLIVLLGGALTRAERDRVSALRERAASLEREQDAVRGEAALEERLRIARDLHDLVGHGLSAIAVQSGTARVALDAGELGAVRTALGNVETSSRAAMQEMRALVGVLREPSPGAAESVPGLDGLPALVEHARRAGVRAGLDPTGVVGQVPPVVGECAYRVVQEALTNVARHAPGAAATVRIDARDGRLGVEVTDRGGTLPGPVSASRGHGLVGMRERVEILGGTLEAGPVDGGGWAVRASLPLREGIGA